MWRHRVGCRADTAGPHQERRRLRDEWGFTDLDFRDVVNSLLLVEIAGIVADTVAAGAQPQQARK
jgi:aspartyl-tRNA(Asn)/glutamyl-tRNA(Gln) amidotransferase subunit B